MSEHPNPRLRALASRWLGIGLAAVISVVTLVLAATGALALYISPESVWFAGAAAVVTLWFAIWSCTLPLGDELAHDHDHGTDAAAPRRTISTVATVSGGAIASGVVVAALVLPPMSLSVDLAMSRAGENGGLFVGADSVSLGVADTSTFGVGEWASVFATATDTAVFDGTEVTLTGFVTPASDGDGLDLTRLVITHCVIDAQTATLPTSIDAGEFETGQWVEVTGNVRTDADGRLHVEPSAVVAIDEPGDPYEY